MEFRKAELSELPEIFEMYREGVRVMIESGIFQWDEVYPSEEVIRRDITDGEMYVTLAENRITSAITLNERHDPEYADGAWQYAHLRHCVVHRLCVIPAAQGKGVAKLTMLYAEELLGREGYDAVWLDTFSENPIALRLYKSIGYQKTGEVTFRKGLFYLFEKKLPQ